MSDLHDFLPVPEGMELYVIEVQARFTVAGRNLEHAVEGATSVIQRVYPGAKMMREPMPLNQERRRRERRTGGDRRQLSYPG